ncbi:MAG: DMT family transporter [Gammaproteobacteria bacterium]|nr:MAG: DMT family transporter [Gammaproteobacteria bacterium]
MPPIRINDDHGHILTGGLFIMVSELLFAAMGGAIRMASTELDNPMIVFGRNLVGAAILLGWLATRGGGRPLATRVPHLHLLRGLSGTGAMYCFFYAIAHMPLAEAMLLKLTSPLFIPLIALTWLHEPLGWRTPLALAIGFAGVLVILAPDARGIDPVALIALAGGVLAALAKVTVRRLSHTESPELIVFYFAVTGLAVSIIPLPWLWQTPSTQALGWVLATGLLATGGQLMLSRGMGRAPAGRLAPFSFFSVVFGAILGWLFWGETVTLATVAGAVLILLSVLVTGSQRLPANRAHRTDRAT